MRAARHHGAEGFIFPCTLGCVKAACSMRQAAVTSGGLHLLATLAPHCMYFCLPLSLALWLLQQELTMWQSCSTSDFSVAAAAGAHHAAVMQYQ